MIGFASGSVFEGKRIRSKCINGLKLLIVSTPPPGTAQTAHTVVSDRLVANYLNYRGLFLMILRSLFANWSKALSPLDCLSILNASFLCIALRQALSKLRMHCDRKPESNQCRISLQTSKPMRPRSLTSSYSTARLRRITQTLMNTATRGYGSGSTIQSILTRFLPSIDEMAYWIDVY